MPRTGYDVEDGGSGKAAFNCQISVIMRVRIRQMLSMINCVGCYETSLWNYYIRELNYTKTPSTKLATRQILCIGSSVIDQQRRLWNAVMLPILHWLSKPAFASRLVRILSSMTKDNNIVGGYYMDEINQR